MDIKFTTDDPAVAEYFPVKPANKVIPEWYRDLDMWKKNQYPGKGLPTIKHCMPVQDMLTSGYIIFNTYDTVIHPIKTGRFTDYKASCPSQDYISSHQFDQCPVKMHGDYKHYFKIKQPWIIKTPPGYSCLFLQPFYHFEERYTLMPSIVDTDVHDLAVEIPGWMDTEEDLILKPGDPIMQVIPFKRDEWEMTVEHAPAKRSLLNFILTAGYRTIFHKKKTFK